MKLYNDFIELGRTTCYFVDMEEYRILTGVINGYDNLRNLVTILYKIPGSENQYEIIYRQRPYIWFILEECLIWINKYLEENAMPKLYVMNLSDQLDGVKNTLETTDTIGDTYTIYLNGLRQNREDYTIDDDNKQIKLLFEPLPNQNDILTIEYWKKN